MEKAIGIVGSPNSDAFRYPLNNDRGNVLKKADSE